MRIALAVLLLSASCTSSQLAAAKAALDSCGTDAGKAALADVLPIVTAVAENQPNASEQIITDLEQISLTGTICSLQRIASQPAARLSEPGKLSPQAFAAKLLASRVAQ